MEIVPQLTLNYWKDRYDKAENLMNPTDIVKVMILGICSNNIKEKILENRKEWAKKLINAEKTFSLPYEIVKSAVDKDFAEEYQMQQAGN